MRRLVTLFALVPLLLAGCDSNDPAPVSLISEVQGTYAIETLRFSAQGVQAADVGQRLSDDLSRTFLRISSAGRVLLSFQLDGDPAEDFINGTASVTVNTVTIVFESAAQAELSRLLLPQTITFARDGNDLRYDQAAVMNLFQYDPANYAPGLDSVNGRLVVELTRQ